MPRYANPAKSPTYEQAIHFDKAEVKLNEGFDALFYTVERLPYVQPPLPCPHILRAEGMNAALSCALPIAHGGAHRLVR
jgi:hypothetical protein